MPHSNTVVKVGKMQTMCSSVLLPAKNNLILPMVMGPILGSIDSPDSFNICTIYVENALKPLQSHKMYNTPTHEYGLRKEDDINCLKVQFQDCFSPCISTLDRRFSLISSNSSLMS